MAEPQIEARIISILVGIIKMLSMAAGTMSDMIGKPQFLDADTRRARFRYEKPDAYVFQLLMCVRIASGLRAALILLRENHTTEVGVILRTIDDFVSQINFVDELIEKGEANVTSSQKDFLDRYFHDDDRITEEMLRDAAKNQRKFNYNAGRQKMQAAEARVFGGDDPHYLKTLVKTIDDTLSGVVHGEYSSVMEMYGGVPPSFHTEGIPARFSEYRHFLGLHIYMGLNVFFKVAYNLGHRELAHHLRVLRQEFEASPAYTAS